MLGGFGEGGGVIGSPQHFFFHLHVAFRGNWKNNRFNPSWMGAPI